MAGVINALHTSGMDLKEVRKIVHNSPSFFEAIIDMTKDVTKQQRNIIAAISFLKYITSTSLFFDEHKYSELLYHAFDYQLKIDQNWRVIARTLSTVLNLVNGHEMLSDEEIEKNFNPVNFELNTYI